MGPAVEWYRRDGGANSLPLILIKWGSAVSGTSRFAAAPAVFQEALALASRHGEEMFEAMALQRRCSRMGSRSS